MASLLYSLPLGSNWLQISGSNDDATETNRLRVKLRELKDDDCSIVLVGEERCGKTLLLFQAAVSYASQNYNVTFISRQPLSHIPLPVHGMVRPETAGQLESLTFLYMNTAKDLIQFCSGIHTKSILPDVVIVDDLQYYSSQIEESSLEVGCALLSAHLLDAVTFTRSKGCSGILMLGCNSKQSSVAQVFKQFSFGVASIKKAQNDTEGFNLSLTTSKTKLSISYSIQELDLVVKSVTFDAPRDET